MPTTTLTPISVKWRSGCSPVAGGVHPPVHHGLRRSGIRRRCSRPRRRRTSSRRNPRRRAGRAPRAAWCRRACAASRRWGRSAADRGHVSRVQFRRDVELAIGCQRREPVRGALGVDQLDDLGLDRGVPARGGGGTLEDRVRTGAAVDGVGSTAAVDHVVAAIAVDGSVPRPP